MEESRGPVSETIQCGWYLTPAFQESVVEAGCRRDSLWTQQDPFLGTLCLEVPSLQISPSYLPGLARKSPPRIGRGGSAI